MNGTPLAMQGPAPSGTPPPASAAVSGAEGAVSAGGAMTSGATPATAPGWTPPPETGAPAGAGVEVAGASAARPPVPPQLQTTSSLRKRQLQNDLASIRLQKAEVLRRIGDLAKRRRTTGQAPDPALAAATSPELRRAALAEEQRRRREALWQSASKLLAALLGNQNTRRYFGAPVDVHYAPSYYQVIQQPMDLGTAKGKLDQRRYESPLLFRDDVRLVFDNCRRFNPVGNHVRALGDAASDKFEKRWAASGLEAAWELELRRSALEHEALDAELRTLPEQLRDVAGELAELSEKAARAASNAAAGGAAAAPPSPPPPPGAPSRPMTFEEKRKLSQDIASLPGERLDGVLALVADAAAKAKAARRDQRRKDRAAAAEPAGALEADAEGKPAAAADGGGEEADGAPVPPATAPSESETESESEEELELDVDALEPEILWALQRYADGVLRQISEKQAPVGQETLPPAEQGAAASPAAGAAPAATAAAGAQPVAAPGGAAQATVGAAAAPDGSVPASAAGGSEVMPMDASESEGVGSKQEAGEAAGESGAANEGRAEGGAGALGASAPRAPGDATTFVSATGPPPPRPVRPPGTRPGVELKNEGAWASLSKPAEAPQEADEDVDDIWSEFQGRVGARGSEGGDE